MRRLIAVACLLAGFVVSFGCESAPCQIQCVYIVDGSVHNHGYNINNCFDCESEAIGLATTGQSCVVTSCEN
jgi:hypothetical protein